MQVLRIWPVTLMCVPLFYVRAAFFAIIIARDMRRAKVPLPVAN